MLTRTLSVQRVGVGRVHDGRCLRPGVVADDARPCRRLGPVLGTIEHLGASGRNTLAFGGRLDGRSLRPGRYRLTATTSTGVVARVSFRVVA